MTQSVIMRSVAPTDLSAISKLHAHVLGPGRFVRSAYRIREGKGLFSKFCCVADLGGRLIATLRITEISVGGTSEAALLGPLTVDPEFAGQGYGRKLVSESLENMKKSGVKLVVLVGDESYYGRLGFKPVPLGQILFSAPVNPGRILAVELEHDALAHYRGLISAAPNADAGRG